MADMSGTIPPLVPLHNSLGETMGSIVGMVANPQMGGTRGVMNNRYVGGVGEPAAMEFNPGRPAVLRGIDVTQVGDPYEHERGNGVRTLPASIVRRRFDEGV